ncbi:dna mismatch repair protein, partial [Lasius niger]
MPLEILHEIFPKTAKFVLAGPNFAKEIAQDLPAVATLSGSDAEKTEDLSQRLSLPHFALSPNLDPISIQLIGAAKNVAAIGVGATIGAGLGENARAAFITYFLREIRLLIEKKSGDPESIFASGGIGDLLLTATSSASRNYSLGEYLGKNKTYPPNAVGGWTMVSRVLGLVRDQLLAVLLGAGSAQDAYQVALRLPNMFRRFFGEGALNAAFVPLFTGEWEKKDRLTQLPLGILGAALGTTLLPTFSKSVANEKIEELVSQLSRAIEIACYLILPTTFGIVAIAPLLVSGLFGYGHFQIFDILQTSKVLRVYALGLPAFVILKAIAPVFFAQGDTSTPVKAGFIAIIINLIASILLYRPLGLLAPAIASDLAAYFNLFMLSIILYRKKILDLPTLLKRESKTLLIALITGALAFEIIEFFGENRPIRDNATPAMSQWFDLKEQEPNALLFFRMGDFYELFFDDAHIAASALDIALTARGEQQGSPIPMCGVPVRAADAYLSRLIKQGFRIAIVEQDNPPPATKGPMPRKIVRIVTPGTITEEELLDSEEPNLLLAIRAYRNKLGIAWADISTGAFETKSIFTANLAELLSRLTPSEILSEEALLPVEFRPLLAPVFPTPTLKKSQKLILEATGKDFDTKTQEEALACGTLLDYLRETQAGTLPPLHAFEEKEASILGMDGPTRQNLEIVKSRRGEKKYSLLWAVDRNVTPAGKRLLKSWLSSPSCAIQIIEERQQAWTKLSIETALLQQIQSALRQVPDLARVIGRIRNQRGSL